MDEMSEAGAGAGVPHPALAAVLAAGGGGGGAAATAAPKAPKAVRPAAAASAPTAALTQYMSLVSRLRGTSQILQQQIDDTYKKEDGNPLNVIVENTFAFLSGNIAEGCGFNRVFDANGEMAVPTVEGLRL